MKKLIILIAMLTIPVVLTDLHAATPDAGQLMREQQPQRQMPDRLPTSETPKEAPPLPESAVRVLVKEIRFSGHEGLATLAELNGLVEHMIGKELGFNDLQALAAKITDHLKAKGWFLARAYLPKQDVTEGVITIQIVQGKSDGGVKIKRDGTVRIRESALQGIGSLATVPGRPLNEKDLERSLLLMRDLPGISARASLSSGAEPGSTAVQVDVSEGPLFAGALWGDNQGNRYTGETRGNAMLNLNDPFRYGDQVSLLVTGSDGVMQGRAAYSFPLTSRGLKSNISFTAMRYKLIGDMESLDSKGESREAAMSFSYPVLKSRTVNVTTTVGYSYKRLTDSTAGTDVRDKTSGSGNASINGDIYDTFLGGGFTTWSATGTTGHLEEGIADIGVTETEGGFTHFNITFARLQRLADRLSLNLSYSGQLSDGNLDSSEKFNLGGPSGVRAYPVGEASGDEGHLFNADLRFEVPLPPSWGTFQLSGFYDAGNIKLHKREWINSIATATNENNYWLQGAGVGLQYAYGARFSLKGSWAHVIEDNPGRSVKGTDADGRDAKSRFWLQAMLYF